MRLLFLIFTISLTVYGQNKEKAEDKQAIEELKFSKEESERIKKDAALKGRDYVLIAKYFENEYLKKKEKELEKDRKAFEKYKDKFSTATTETQKKAIVRRMKEIKLKFDLHDLLKKYHQAYLIKNQAVHAKDNDRFYAAKKILIKIKTEYSKLSAQSFPAYRGEFYNKYKDSLDKLRRDYLK